MTGNQKKQTGETQTRVIRPHTLPGTMPSCLRGLGVRVGVLRCAQKKLREERGDRGTPGRKYKVLNATVIGRNVGEGGRWEEGREAWSFPSPRCSKQHLFRLP